MIVDDEPGCLFVFSRFAEQLGYEVFSAGDAEAGYAACVRHYPAVVIADVVMRGESGIEMGVRVHRVMPETRFLLVSAIPSLYWKPEAAAALVGLPAHCYRLLAKPFSRETMALELRRLTTETDRAPQWLPGQRAARAGR